jgi:calcineurin-like phosphoesterase family protein
MNWFTSDWHLSHFQVMVTLKRPFKSTEEMNEVIIDNFYSSVKPGDNVYFIGDMSFDKKTANDFFEKKPRNIYFHFIYGNHDKNIKQLIKKHCSSFSWIKDIKINNQKITLCHYMMASWNHSHWGAWHLFGHHHNKIQADHSIGKTLDVCVDLHNFKPLSFEEVEEYIKNRPDNWDLIKNA